MEDNDFFGMLNFANTRALNIYESDQVILDTDGSVLPRFGTEEMRVESSDAE